MAQLPAVVRFVNSSPQERNIIGTCTIPLEEGEIFTPQEELEVVQDLTTHKVQWFPGGWSQENPTVYPGSQYADGSYRYILCQFPVDMAGEAGLGEGVTEVTVQKGPGPDPARGAFTINPAVLTCLQNITWGVTFEGVTNNIALDFSSLNLVEGNRTNGNNLAGDEHARRYERFVRFDGARAGFYVRVTLELYHLVNHFKWWMTIGHARARTDGARTHNPIYTMAPGQGIFMVVNSSEATGVKMYESLWQSLEDLEVPPNWSYRLVDPAFPNQASMQNFIAGPCLDYMGVVTCDASQTSVSMLLEDDCYGLATNWGANPSGRVNDGICFPQKVLPQSPYATEQQGRDELDALCDAFRLLSTMPQREVNFRSHPFLGFPGTPGGGEQAFSFNYMTPVQWMMGRTAWPKKVVALLLLGCRHFTKKWNTHVYEDGSPALYRNHSGTLFFTGAIWFSGSDWMGYTTVYSNGQVLPNPVSFVWAAVEGSNNLSFIGPDRAHHGYHGIMAAAMMVGDYRVRKIQENMCEVWCWSHNPTQGFGRGLDEVRSVGRGANMGAYHYAVCGHPDVLQVQKDRHIRYRDAEGIRNLGERWETTESKPSWPWIIALDASPSRANVDYPAQFAWQHSWSATGIYSWSQIMHPGFDQELARFLAFSVAKTSLLYNVFISGYKNSRDLLWLWCGQNTPWTGPEPIYTDPPFRIRGLSSGAEIDVIACLPRTNANLNGIRTSMYGLLENSWNGIKFQNETIEIVGPAGYFALGSRIDLWTTPVRLINGTFCQNASDEGLQFGSRAHKPMDKNILRRLSSEQGVNNPFAGQGTNPWERWSPVSQWDVDYFAAAAVAEAIAFDVGEVSIVERARKWIETYHPNKAATDGAVGNQWGGTVGWGGRFPYTAMAALEAPYQPSQADYRSRLGLNISNIRNYENEVSRMFTNNLDGGTQLLEIVDDFGITPTGNELLNIRSDGFPGGIRSGTKLFTGLFNGIAYDDGPETYRTGTYYFSCLGSGRVEFQADANADTGEFTNGIFLFPVVIASASGGSTGILLYMRSTNTDAGAGPIRDWSLVHEDDLADFVAGRRFQTNFLARWSPIDEIGVECLRTMNMSAATGDDDWRGYLSDDDYWIALNPQEDWSDRRPLNHQTQVGGAHQVALSGPPRIDPGVSWELLVEMCNQMDIDLWVTIPPKATIDDTYLPEGERSFDTSINPWDNQKSGWGRPRTFGDGFINNLLEYIRDNLDPNLRVFIEWGNEIWNGDFNHKHYCSRDTGPTMGLAQARNIAPLDDEYTRSLKANAVRSREIFLCARQIFHDQTFRIVCVMGGRFAGEGDLDNILGVAWMPSGRETWRKTDAWAINHYYGTSLTNEWLENLGTPRTVNEILAELETGAVFNDGVDQKLDALGTLGSSIKAHVDRFGFDLNHPVVGEPLGLVVVGYEGEQHVGYSGSVLQVNLNLKAAFRSTGPAPSAEALNQKYYEGIQDIIGTGVFCSFLSMQQYPDDGDAFQKFYWGLWEHPAQNPQSNRPARGRAMFTVLQTHNNGGPGDPVPQPDRIIFSTGAELSLEADSMIIRGDPGSGADPDNIIFAGAALALRGSEAFRVRRLGDESRGDRGGGSSSRHRSASPKEAQTGAPPPPQPPAVKTDRPDSALHRTPGKTTVDRPFTPLNPKRSK